MKHFENFERHLKNLISILIFIGLAFWVGDMIDAIIKSRDGVEVLSNAGIGAVILLIYLFVDWAIVQVNKEEVVEQISVPAPPLPETERKDQDWWYDEYDMRQCYNQGRLDETDGVSQGGGLGFEKFIKLKQDEYNANS